MHELRPRFSNSLTESSLTLGRHLALINMVDAPLATFSRCTPSHCVLVGFPAVVCRGNALTARAVAIPAHTPHSMETTQTSNVLAVYLDVRRYRFQDAEWLAHALRGFLPARDDPREVFGDALKRSQRMIDPRVERLFDVLGYETENVVEAARRCGLSESRATHLMTETLGAPPRTFRRWRRLLKAIAAVAFRDVNLTQAAHAAGFADSAHFVRTSKGLLGVRPSHLVPPRVYVSPQT